jgi:glutamate racemase
MEKEVLSNHPIGVFDSGVGGLSVLRAVHAELPHEELIYVGDQAHVPYGSRSLKEVRQLSESVTRFLLAEGAKLIVVACNAASAAALRCLREKYPQTPFVGMEPAVKPAAEHTLTGKVGVLATPATFQGELYASVVERFAHGVDIYQDTCPGLVGQIETGRLATRKTRKILEQALLPMLSAGIDTVVLGCTHYPFVMPLIQEIVGADVRVIDPAPAVARQVRRVLEANSLLNNHDQDGDVCYLTSADPVKLGRLLPKLLGEAGEVSRVVWTGDGLLELSDLSL